VSVSPAVLHHSVTCHREQVNAPDPVSSQAGRYSIYIPQRDGRLSWPGWLVIILRWFNCQNNNGAQCIATISRETNTLPLLQTATLLRRLLVPCSHDNSVKQRECVCLMLTDYGHSTDSATAALEWVAEQLSVLWSRHAGQRRVMIACFYSSASSVLWCRLFCFAEVIDVFTSFYFLFSAPISEVTVSIVTRYFDTCSMVTRIDKTGSEIWRLLPKNLAAQNTKIW